MIRTSRARPRRSFVLIAVLVIVGSAVLVGTSLLFIAQSEAAGAAGAADAAQARALAWSGLQALMSRLQDQRDRILGGDVPVVEREMQIYESNGRIGVARLLPIDDSKTWLAPQAGRVDLNSVDADGLVRTGLIGQDAATAIIAYRNQCPGQVFNSVAELLQVPDDAVSPETLYGPMELFDITTDGADATGSAGERSDAGLDSVVTVFSVDCCVQRNGERRINVNQPWSQELGRSIEQQLGKQVADHVQRALESDRLERLSKLVGMLRRSQLEIEQWPDVLDALTVTSAAAELGRLDVNSAPREAMLSLPGLTAEQVAQVLSVREELGSDERSTVAWLVTTGIVSPETFEAIVDRVTTRSWSYRVRIESGERPEADQAAALTSRIITEAVIDLSSGRPRVAYLRDITMLEQTARYATEVTAARPAQFGTPPPASETSMPTTGPTETRQVVDPDAGQIPNLPSQPDQPATSPRSNRSPQRPVARWIVG